MGEAYCDEPWSLQSMEKRIYAIRDFYKRELKGTELDNPGHDDLVEGTRAALVLLIGRNATHVPQVRAQHASIMDCLLYMHGKCIGCMANTCVA